MKTEASRTAPADSPASPAGDAGLLHLLSSLTLTRLRAGASDGPSPADAAEILSLDDARRARLLHLASSNHVLMRSLLLLAEQAGDDVPGWLEAAMVAEQNRIQKALHFLDAVCGALHGAGCNATVIKSLDHWPDLGSDLDLFSSSDAREIIEVMRSRFQARLMPRSWGDRLANKWNFQLPGLPELIEVHVGRLGQTGEHVGFGKRLQARSIVTRVGGYAFRVASPEDRLIITTLQRMYRHFYLRLCDILDTAVLLESRSIDYAYLRTNATAAGIWDGVATFLSIVSDYLAGFRGDALGIPSIVRSSACFSSGDLFYRKEFLRVPILPHSARLYASQLSRLALSGDVQATFRLSLLPYLATAAALEMKLTGSDKGIW